MGLPMGDERVELLGALGCEQLGAEGGIAEHLRQLGKYLQMQVGRPLGHEQHENELHVLAVGRVEGNRLPRAHHRAHRLLQYNPDPFSAPGEWLRASLHTHSTLSDGALNPEQLRDKYRDEGYSVLCITDVHYGKKTETYSPLDCELRFGQLSRKLAEIQSIVPECDELVICLLGDINDGTNIFPTQTHYQELTNVEAQATLVSNLLTQFALDQRDLWGKVRIEAVPGNHGRCHDPETELLTQEGWKRHDQLRLGENVAT